MMIINNKKMKLSSKNKAASFLASVHPSNIVLIFRIRASGQASRLIKDATYPAKIVLKYVSAAKMATQHP